MSLLGGLYTQQIIRGLYLLTAMRHTTASMFSSRTNSSLSTYMPQKHRHSGHLICHVCIFLGHLEILQQIVLKMTARIHNQL